MSMIEIWPENGLSILSYFRQTISIFLMYSVAAKGRASIQGFATSASNKINNSLQFMLRHAD